MQSPGCTILPEECHARDNTPQRAKPTGVSGSEVAPTAASGEGRTGSCGARMLRHGSHARRTLKPPFAQCDSVIVNDNPRLGCQIAIRSRTKRLRPTLQPTTFKSPPLQLPRRPAQNPPAGATAARAPPARPPAATTRPMTIIMTKAAMGSRKKSGGTCSTRAGRFQTAGGGPSPRLHGSSVAVHLTILCSHREFDANSGHYFYVDTKAHPPRSIWSHPLDVSPPSSRAPHRGVSPLTPVP